MNLKYKVVRLVLFSRQIPIEPTIQLNYQIDKEVYQISGRPEADQRMEIILLFNCRIVVSDAQNTPARQQAQGFFLISIKKINPFFSGTTSKIIKLANRPPRVVSIFIATFDKGSAEFINEKRGRP